MATDEIKISLGEVTKTAGTIRTLNTQLDAKLAEIKKQMNDLAQTWQSDASTTIREKFNAQAAKFEDYKSVVESYAKFLDNTVQSYEATENSNNNNASQFK